jgi:hypothetical protein
LPILPKVAGVLTLEGKRIMKARGAVMERFPKAAVSHMDEFPKALD